jgi:hypothetical protein
MPQPDHDAQLLQIENHAEQIFLQNPDGYKDVFKDLQQLKKSESKEDFAKDLEAINLKLHEDGWLPTMEIVMTPKGGFMLRRQSNQDWQSEQKQQQQQYNDSNYRAPAPAASPQGYNSGYSPSGGRSGGGGYQTNTPYDSSRRGNPGRFRYNPQISGDAARRILEMSHNCKSKQMWRETNHGASGANLGCAASVSAVLRDAGVSKVSEMECHRLQAALQQEGWTVTNTPSPGDVVFGYGGLSKAHVGIVDQNGGVMDNHSSTGQWSQDSLSYFNNWNQTVFLHPPQAENPTPAPVHHVAPVANPGG